MNHGLGALRVDLHQVDVIDLPLEIIVDAHGRDLDRRPVLTLGLVDAVVALVVRRDEELERGVGVGERLLLGDDVVGAVQADVPLQELEGRRIRLEGIDAARRADELRGEDRVVADVGARIDDDVTRTDGLDEPVRVARLPDSLLEDALGDDGIARIEEERHGPHARDVLGRRLLLARLLSSEQQAASRQPVTDDDDGREPEEHHENAERPHGGPCT